MSVDEDLERLEVAKSKWPRVKTWCPECGEYLILTSVDGKEWDESCPECRTTWIAWLGEDGVVNKIERFTGEPKIEE